MCKSKIEGGQRCAGHARDRQARALANFHETVGRYARGEVDHATATAAYDAVTAANVDYASTLEGSTKLRNELAQGEAYYAEYGEADVEEGNAELRKAIDAGANLAQANREAENAYRATQGKPPLTTPVPLTLAQEAEAARVQREADEARLQRQQDPFGLRAQAQNDAARAQRTNSDTIVQVARETHDRDMQAHEAAVAEACGCRNVGGQKCYEHARADAQAAETTHRGGGFLRRLDSTAESTAAVEVAMTQFASTPRGNDEIRERMAHLDALVEQTSPWSVKRWRWQRERRGLARFQSNGAALARRALEEENQYRADRGLPQITRPIPASTTGSLALDSTFQRAEEVLANKAAGLARGSTIPRNKSVRAFQRGMWWS